MAGGVALVWALPGLLDGRIRSQLLRAEEELLVLMEELATGIASGDRVDELLEQIARVVGARGDLGNRRFSPLIRDLFDRAATAALLSPARGNACRVFADSEIPTAPMIAVAWSQADMGVNVPASLRDLAEAAREELRFQRELRAKLRPVRKDVLTGVSIPAFILGLLTWHDPGLALAMFQFPSLGILLGGFVVMVLGLAWMFQVWKELG